MKKISRIFPRVLAGPDFPSMQRVLVSYSQPIRFAKFDGKRIADFWCWTRPEGSWTLGARMTFSPLNFLRLLLVFIVHVMR